MIDHSKSVRDIIGSVTNGYVKDEKVFIEAEINDASIQKLAKKNLVKYFSIGASAVGTCNKCNKVVKAKRCSCKDSHLIIKNVKLNEVSIVLDPAFTAAEFKPFSSAVDSAFTVIPDSTNSKINLVECGGQSLYVEDKNLTDKENKVEATVAVGAGPEAIILLAEMSTKLECLKEDVANLKTEMKVKEEMNVKTEALMTKMESLITKLETKPAAKEENEDKEEDEDKEETEEKTEKKASKGGKIETPEAVEINAESDVPSWCAELADFAKKNGIIF